MGKIIASISHKGGTGRSVTTANVGYHLAKSGLDVCILDLDLASPTFGSVVGFSDIPAGVDEVGKSGNPKSIGDFLRDKNNVPYWNKAARDIWQSTSFNRARIPAVWGSYQLIPGSKHLGDIGSSDSHEESLNRLILELCENFDVVYLDVRSGASELFDIFRRSSMNGIRPDLWMVHFRWTKQHLNGLADLLELLEDVEFEKLHLVRTAFMDSKKVTPDARRIYIESQDRQLDEILREIRVGDRKISEQLLGTIPLETLLQWREGIVIEALAAEGLAEQKTIDSFSALANKIRVYCET